MKTRHLTVLILVLTFLAGLSLTSSRRPAVAYSQQGVPPRPFVSDQGLVPRPHLAGYGRDPAAPLTPAGVTILGWSKVAFQSYRDGNWEIYTGNDDGGGQTRLTNNGSNDTHADLNRGSSRLAFASDRNGEYEIYTMNADGSGQTRLTTTSSDNFYPAWSPDGTRIAFSSYRDGQSEIYVMNADGSGQARLTNNSAYDGHPSWSPDGSQLAFTSNRSGDYRIWVMDADGANPSQLSNYYLSENATWSPDGSQIAYDADGDGDGWQELWVMNADGSNQHEVYDPAGYQTDAWARSWSPDGRYVAFTLISWYYYQGYYYWTEAYLDAWDTTTSSTTVRLSSNSLDWFPHWQTTDIQIPSSSVNALPAESPGPIPVTWSGSDSGSSGIDSYDVQVKVGSSGAWTDWLLTTTATSGSYSGVGGSTYYFRSRARDNAYNLEAYPAGHDTFTTVENDPPNSAVHSLPAYSPTTFEVSWGGTDPGASGIASYDVQYRLGASGSWTTWQQDTTATTADFTGTAGNTYYFRARAEDNAQNVEAWPSGDGDTSTTLYTWGISGVVRGNGGAPVSGVTADTDPAAFVSLTSDLDGRYATYVSERANSYTATWAKAGYGTLPSAFFDAAAADTFDVVLPPHDNVVGNWDFETGNLGPEWAAGGTPLPVITDTVRHTGDYAAFLGQFSDGLAPPYLVTTGNSVAILWEMVMSENDTLHLLWQDNYDLYYVERSAAGVWSAVQNLTNSAAEDSWPQMVIGDDGTAHVAWERTFEYDSDIYYMRRTGGVWSAPEVASTDGATYYGPELAVDSDNNVHIAWGGLEVYYRRRSSFGVWEAQQTIYVSDYTASRVGLAVDGQGNAHIVFPDSSSSTSRNIYYTFVPSGSIWNIIENVSNDSSYYAYHDKPEVAVDENDIAHVIWVGDGSIQYAQRLMGGEWSSRLAIGDLSRADPDPLLAGEESGVLHVVFGGEEIFYVRRNLNGLWTSPLQISDNNVPFATLEPFASLDGGNLVHVAYEYGGKAYHIHQLSQDAWTTPATFNGNLSPYGVAPPVVDNYGDFHLVFSSLSYNAIYYVGPERASSDSTAVLSQSLTVPGASSNPVLSFLYQLHNTAGDGDSAFRVKVNNTTLWTSNAPAETWTQQWLDLTPWAGQSVTLQFELEQAAGEPLAWAYLDEVSLGTTYPDVWVAIDPTAALPGEQVVIPLHYGNRGAAPASAIRITNTLPAELTFVSASLPPVATSPNLVWEISDLPANSSFTIYVTATVSPAAPLWTNLTTTASIVTDDSTELETANNAAAGVLYVGRLLYLPIIYRE
ncbi:MAG: hypothetical protein AB1791_05090 [Chloroflexota bacterium]